MSSHPNPERQARYQWATQVVASGRVLDAGCGAGWGTATLARGASESVGIDISPVAIGEAKKRYGERVRFHEGDVSDMPFRDGEFDHVVCFEALSQIEDAERALDELRRVLAPGGTLLISAPNSSAYPPGNPLHVRELDSAELASLLADRFARVAVHRQQSYHASLLGSTAMLAHDDAEAPISAQIVKAAGGPAGSELHAVAAASDGDLPPAPACLALGELVDYQEQQLQLEEWRQRAVRAEAKAMTQSRELRALRSPR